MKKSKENVINLDDYRVDGAKVFTGRDRGEYVRNQSRIDDLENKYDTLSVVIPDNIYSINPSFFEELFLNVVLKLGRSEFLRRFKFISEGKYNYDRPLNEALDRILRTKTALD